MKVGDLVRCIWQPRSSHIENDCAVPLNITIKGEIGVIVQRSQCHNIVSFPQLMHEQPLSDRVLELVNESR